MKAWALNSSGQELGQGDGTWYEDAVDDQKDGVAVPDAADADCFGASSTGEQLESFLPNGCAVTEGPRGPERRAETWVGWGAEPGGPGGPQMRQDPHVGPA